MKKFLTTIYGLMLLVLVTPYPSIAQTEEIDKKTLRDQRRQERKQEREIRREERLKERNQSGSTPAPTAIQPTDESNQKVTRKQPQSEPQEETYQEEPSKNKSQSRNIEPAATQPAGASNKTNTQKQPVQTQPVTHQETSPTRSSESTIESAIVESESNLLKPLLIWGILLYLVYRILRWIFSRRCKKCGKFRAMTTIDENYLGRVKTERNQNGSYVHSNRIKFTRQCKYCGHQDHIIKTVKEKN